MKQRIPNSKLFCYASIFALSLSACSTNSNKTKTDANLYGSASKEELNQFFKLTKGHRAKKLGLSLPDPSSYDNLWDRLFDRFDLPEVSHSDVDRELQWFVNHPTYIERVQSRAEPFLYSIVKQLEKQNLPGELALLPVIESAFQPHVVSPAHAAGIWQFIPATGRHYGLKQSYSYDGRRDIYASTRAAIKYLKKLHREFNGDWLLAIAGYNCGEGAVARAIQKNMARGLPTDFWSLDLPQETRSYVPRLLAVAKLFSESDQYGVSLRPIPNKALYKTVKLDTQVDLAMAADAADISLDRLFELNPGFKRQKVDVDGSYRLFIPAHKKIVDFKDELARLIAARGYEAYGSSTEQTANGSASPDFQTQSPAGSATAERAKPKSVELKSTELASGGESLVVGEIGAQSAPQPESSERTVATAVESSSSGVQADGQSLIEAGPSAVVDRTKHSVGSSYSADNESGSEKTASLSSYQSNGVDVSVSDSGAVLESEAIAEVHEPHRALSSSETAAQKGKENSRRGEGGKSVAREASAAAIREMEHSVRKTGPKSREDTVAERRVEPISSAKKVSYVVQEGDTAYSIARKHDMDLEELKRLNHIADATDIKWGQSLQLKENGVKEKDVGGKEKDGGKKPAMGGGKSAAGKPSLPLGKYTAHDGETLFSISKRFNVSVADLRKWNGIKDDRQFRAGSNLTVSGEKD